MPDPLQNEELRALLGLVRPSGTPIPGENGRKAAWRMVGPAAGWILILPGEHFELAVVVWHTGAAELRALTKERGKSLRDILNGFAAGTLHPSFLEPSLTLCSAKAHVPALVGGASSGCVLGLRTLLHRAPAVNLLGEFEALPILSMPDPDLGHWWWMRNTYRHGSGADWEHVLARPNIVGEPLGPSNRRLFWDRVINGFAYVGEDACPAQWRLAAGPPQQGE